MRSPASAVLDWLRRVVPRIYFDLATVLGGAVTRNLFRGIVKLLVAGFLSTRSLGVLRAVYALFKITVSLADLALDYAAVTLVAAALKKGEHDERERILATVLTLKLAIVAGLLVAGNLFAPTITSWVFSDPTLTIYTRLVFLAVGGQLLWRYVSGYLSAHQEFGKFALFLTTVPFAMLATTGILILTGRFSLRAAILVYLFTPAVAAAVWWPFAGAGVLRHGRWSRAIAGKILRFSRWVYVSNVASANRNHLNPILLKNPHLSGSLAAGEQNAGLYAFGNDLANELTVFSQSLLTVLLPKASRKLTTDKLGAFVRRSYRHLLFLSVPMLLLVFAAKPALLTLGHFKASYLDYLPSLRIFTILYVGTLFSVASVPMKTALYSMRRPQVETWVELVSIPLLIGGCVLVIPRFGGEGAAWIVFAQRFVAFAALLSYGFLKLRRKEARVT